MGTLSQSISKTPRPPSRWPGRVNTELWDRRSSTPIGRAGGSPPCSVTRHRSLLRWGPLARAGAAMRFNFSAAPKLKFQIFLASFTPGEQFIRKRGRAAFISPPKEESSAGEPISTGQVGVVRRVDLPAGAEKMIALTFDLCEQPDEVAGYQGDIVDLLRAEKARATFFAGGKWLLTHKLRAEQLM